MVYNVYIFSILNPHLASFIIEKPHLVDHVHHKLPKIQENKLREKPF